MTYIPIQFTAEVIGRRYQLQNEIGAGGMGTVYRALDRLTGGTVALKRITLTTEDLLFGSVSTSQSLELSLANEFSILSSLRHPNLVSVLDYGFEANKQPFFTMDLIDQAQTIVAASTKLPLEGKIHLVSETLQALAYVHRRGVLHRDLKPGNILCSADGQLKVVDFGLSVEISKATKSNSSGTIAYMAPEIFKEQPASISSDLYSVGMIAYEILAGKHPFDAQSISNLVEQVLYMVPDVAALGL